MNKIRYTLPLLIWFVSNLICMPRLLAVDVLERRISVSFYQTPIKDALNEISNKGGFEWSYNAGILDYGKKVNAVIRDQTVREVLIEILGTEYTFKQSGEYLILKKAKKPEQRVIGYLSDPKTGQKVPNATIYDRKTLRSTTTDRNGYYEIPVLPGSELVVTKQAYHDTVFQVNPQTPHYLKLEIHPDTAETNADALAAMQQQLVQTSDELERFFVNSVLRINNLNVRDSLHRRFQFSLLPKIGTNFLMSGSVENDFSFNLLAGYSKGNNLMEIAGLGNLTRENVEGVQIAGLFNEVHGRVDGIQAAGLYNRAVKGFTGIQSAGLFNWSSGPAQGVQTAGLFNSADGGKVLVQAAGLLNVCRSSTVNMQAAGLANLADTVLGIQASPFFNRAHRVKGVQIGIVNRAREIEGMQIGLLNFSRRGGYIVLELGANEVHWSNLSFKTGTRYLYTIFTAGYSPDSPLNDRLWSYGAGLGVYFPAGRHAGLNLDLLHRHLNQGAPDFTLQEWEQVSLGFDIRFGRHLSLAFGPSANLFVQGEAPAGETDIVPRIIPSGFPNKEVPDEEAYLHAWVGAHASLRFRF